MRLIKEFVFEKKTYKSYISIIKKLIYLILLINFLILNNFNNIYAASVKILLDSNTPEKTKSKSSNIKKWVINSPNDLYLRSYSKSNYKKPSFNKKWPANKNLNIIIKNNFIYLNNKKLLLNNLYLSTKDNTLNLDGQEFHGIFIVYKHKNDYLLINKLDLEEYICSVLKTETWPGWPEEMNKVCAIACRSYIIAKILEARKTKKPYHVLNTNKHQTYSGKHNISNLYNVVEQTKGIIMGYKQKPVLAMFDCCCGGIIPAQMSQVNFKKAPYLARNYPCHYCKSWKHHSWEAEYNLANFRKAIKEEFPKIEKIKEIKLIKDPAGIVKSVKINDGKKDHIFKGKKIYSIFKEVKSFCFSISKKENKVRLAGQGYGHHLGVCQWGARQMIKEGWNANKILKFFFPGINFMQIK